MNEPVRSLKLNTPAAAWFNSTSKDEGTAKPTVSNLGKSLARIAAACASPAELLKQLAQEVTANSICLGLWVGLRRGEIDADLRFQPLLDSTENQLWLAVGDEVQRLTRLAKQDGVAFEFALPKNLNRILCVTPIWSGDQIEEFVAGCFEKSNRVGAHPHELLTLVAQAISLWRKRKALESQLQVNSTLHQIAHAVQSISQASSKAEAAIALVNHAKRLLGAKHVALATGQTDGSIHIEAISDIDRVDTRNEHIQRLTSCFRGLSTHDRPIMVRSSLVEPSNSNEQDLIEYCRLARTTAGAYFPLQAQGRTVAGILVGGDDSWAENRQLMEQAAQLVGQFVGPLKQAMLADRPWHRVLFESIQNRAKRLRRRMIGIAFAACLGLCLCPTPHRVGCESQLQPIVRRYVAAPFEGVLNEVLVRCGDVVEADQLLARMDGSALEMELAGLEAQFAAAQKRRDAALAGGNVAESQIAKSEMKRVDSQIGLVNSKLGRLEIRSPLSGVVVSGDMEKVQGARLEMGQSLFEVAPLQSINVEIQVPEIDARHVRSGQTVSLKFSAYPFRNWTGQIERLHPRSELVDDDNVFIAEVNLDNPDQTLRPGMKGKARIATGWKPLLWVCLHHAWERVRYVFIW